VAKTTYPELVGQVRAGALTPEAAADRLLAELTPRERLGLLDGDLGIFQLAGLAKLMATTAISAGAIPRLGYPGVRFSDGPRGVVIGNSTAFPVTMARAATWDPELEERIGLAMGREARAQGANYSGAVCINLVRHPAWGRAQESYGDDPVLLGTMGAALTRGLRRNVMACVKHFALNSMENARFRVDVVVDEHALHEAYLPHFRRVIEAGADSVMSAYNSVNGAFAGENRPLLTDILRDEWGFRGFVTSDWVWGVHDGVASLTAGLDVEMPFRMHRARELPKALRSGRVDPAVVEATGRRVVAGVIRHAAQRDEEEPGREVVACAEHRALARAAAVEGMVLLRNEPVDGAPVLPLPAGLGRIAVIGPLADQANLGDHGSSLVRPPSTVSPLDGIRAAFPGASIVHADGADVDAAVEAARGAEAAVLVVGMGADDEGERVVNEDMDLSIFGFPLTLKPVQRIVGALTSPGQFRRGGDRDLLTLHPQDEELVLRVAAANPRTVVVVIGGSAIIMERWRQAVPGILMAWYPGMEGGHAIADVLTGAEEPGGRLPMAFPAAAEHLPFFDPDASRIVYDAWWGQRKLDRDGNAAAWPFGFGLGYTTFHVEALEERDASSEAPLRVRVGNTGGREGSTVVQLYAVDDAADTPVPQLVGFRRVRLGAGEETVVDVPIDLTPTRQRDPATRAWTARPGRWRIIAAQHSPDAALIRYGG